MYVRAFFLSCWLFFVFKQKTAYEMRISDWSSDVCSSDLGPGVDRGAHQPRPHRRPDRPEAPPCGALLGLRDRGAHRPDRHDQPLEPPHGGNPLAMIDD